jgi:hypothetical protein
VIREPDRGELGRDGALTLYGGVGGICTASEVAEKRVTEPAVFIAVSPTRRYLPSSDSSGVYAEVIAPEIDEQPDGARLDVVADPVLVQRYHCRLMVGVGVPVHTPALADASVPMMGAEVTLGSAVGLGRTGEMKFTLRVTGGADSKFKLPG